jgi:hypothetical protein
VEIEMTGRESVTSAAPVAPNVATTRRPPLARRNRPRRLSGRTLTWIIGSYVLIAATANLGSWVHGASTYITGCPGNCQADPLQSAWFLAFTPDSLIHFHNPFLTNVINYPTGLNMMNDTFMPLLGLLVSPVTFIWGSTAAFNVLTVLAIAGSATAAFFVFRRWAPWTPAAYIGGLFYGCSPYMESQGVAHPMLLMVPLPPLILLILDEILVRQVLPPRRMGIVLGLLVTAQLLISTEVLGTTFLMSLIGLALLMAFRWRLVAGHLRHAVRALAVASSTALVLCAYPLWLFLWGPEHVSGTVQRESVNFLSTDVLSVLLPSQIQRISPSGLQSITNAIAPFGVTYGADGAYIGIPLLVVLVFVVVRFRHIGIVRFAAAMAVVALLLSFGTTLNVDGHSTGIPLPFRIVTSLPLLRSAIAYRLTLYVALFCALLLAVGLDRVHKMGIGRVRPGLPGAMAALSLAVVGLVPVLPAWPYPSNPTAVPGFFNSNDAKSIPLNSVLLTYPFPRWPFVQPMYWQAVDEFRFKLPGGYITSATPPGAATTNGTPSLTESFLEGCEEGEQPQASNGDVQQSADDLRGWGVSTIVVTQSAADPECAVQLFQTLLGRPPVKRSGEWVWFGVQSDLGST